MFVLYHMVYASLNLLKLTSILETAISQNQDRALITEDHKQKTTLLTKHLAHLEKEKTVQV